MNARLIYILLSLLPSLIYSQSSPDPEAASNSSFIWLLMQAIFALLLVIGGIFLVVWVLKQFMNRTQRGASGTSTNFRVVKQIPVTPKHQLFAVRFLDDLFILGGNESGLTKIDCYRDFDRWEVFETGASPIQDNFRNIFKGKIAGRFTGTNSGSGAQKQ